MKYVGWIYESAGRFVLQLNVDLDGETRVLDGLPTPFKREFTSAQECVDHADGYFKREVELSQTPLGWRIS